tara:strand:- start:209 stop:445 length:237 start_codon:yes stop_codon:yes gene_type:complete
MIEKKSLNSILLIIRVLQVILLILRVLQILSRILKLTLVTGCERKIYVIYVERLWLTLLTDTAIDLNIHTLMYLANKI